MSLSVEKLNVKKLIDRRRRSGKASGNCRKKSYYLETWS
jgi:hypothetical protein